MANGYCPALLAHLADVTGSNYPGQKVTQPGFLRMLLNQPNRPQINQALVNGHTRSFLLKYKVRSTEAQVATTETCDIDVVPSYKETSVTCNNIVQIGIHVADSTLRQYCEDASRTVQVGQPATTMMTEHLDSILHQFQGLYAVMDRTLATSMSTKFGKNARTGSAASANINFALNGTQMNLQQGMGQILADTEINEFCGIPAIVGNGNFHSWHLQKMNGVFSANQSGIDMTQTMGYDWFYDQKTASTWGDNQIGVFAPGSVHLVEWLNNVGVWGGDKMTVFKGVLADPRVQCWTPQGMSNVLWDFKFKYIDCPTTLTDGYNGGTATYTEGWALYIMKKYDLFVTPTDAYDGGDPIAGQNGTLRYTIQNA